MLGFIDTQTQWYLDKAKALDKVTNQMLDLHPDGLRRKQMRINKAFHLMNFFTQLSRSAIIGFGDGALTETQEAGFTMIDEQIAASKKLTDEYFMKKREHLFDTKRYSSCPNYKQPTDIHP